MTQIEPLIITIPDTGLALGYAVLNMDRTVYAAFTTTGMVEVGSTGVYAVAGGVVVPDAGGYIQVYKAPGTEFVGEAAVRSTSANVTMHAGVAVAAADANGNVPTVLYPTQGAVTFGQVKILANVSGEGALHVVNSHANGHGQRNQGGNAGQYNYGSYAGQYNYGSNGQYNYGSYNGQYNYGSYNGQYNYGLTEAGQLNQGSLPIIGAAQQEIADALKLAPAAGTPAPGSVYGLLGDAAIDPQAVRDAMKLAPSAGAPAAGSVDAHLDAVALEATAQAVLTAVNAIEPGGGSYAGDGTGYYTDTIDDGTNPLDGVRVQLYTAQNRVGPAYEAYTNALGVFEMWPDPGTYYRWLDLAGFSFTQDVAVVVTEP